MIITLITSIMMAGQPALVMPSREFTLLDRRWKHVWSRDSGSRGSQRHAYYHPDSIRRATDKETVYAVTTVVEWRDGDEPEDRWGYYSTGLLVDCEDRTIRVEWTIEFHMGKPVPNVILQPLPREPGGYQVDIVDRVCQDR